MKRITLLLCLLALHPLPGYAASSPVIQSEKETLPIEIVTDGLRIPREMAIISNTRLPVIEREARIRPLNIQSKTLLSVQWQKMPGTQLASDTGNQFDSRIAFDEKSIKKQSNT